MKSWKLTECYKLINVKIDQKRKNHSKGLKGKTFLKPVKKSAKKNKGKTRDLPGNKEPRKKVNVVPSTMSKAQNPESFIISVLSVHY